jgi:uncharacterized membrane protein (DUF2068 family)
MDILISRNHSKDGLRVVSIFEATKGLLVLLTGCGLLEYVHRDLHLAAEQLVRHFHLNPASHYPRVFIDLADHITDGELWIMALSAVLYSVVRFVELIRKITWPKVTVLGVNAVIVAYLAHILYHSRRHRKHVRE